MPETPASTLAATVSSSDTPVDSHTSTAQWQSFEARMQKRRAHRCLLRAEAALDGGLVDDARQGGGGGGGGAGVRSVGWTNDAERSGRGLPHPVAGGADGMAGSVSRVTHGCRAASR